VLVQYYFGCVFQHLFLRGSWATCIFTNLDSVLNGTFWSCSPQGVYSRVTTIESQHFLLLLLLLLLFDPIAHHYQNLVYSFNLMKLRGPFL
jgi:hypothetical protein